jgi:sugar phosphate isomerase/epimerase
MRVEMFRSLWGVDAPMDVVLPVFAAQGYRGIEVGALLDKAEQRALKMLLEEHRLDYIAMVFSQGDTVRDHLDSVRQQIEGALACGARQITLHGWRDSSHFDDGCRFIEGVLQLEQSYNIRCGHETHRGRLLFNPWTTAAYVNRYPDMHICADLSHWACVAERLLADCEDIIAQVAARTIHLHSRVGHSQGPQVIDPRMPRYSHEVSAHEHWWRMIYLATQARNESILTVTPEYGPPPYQAIDPMTNEPYHPLADLIEWQHQRIRELFA